MKTKVKKMLTIILVVTIMLLIYSQVKAATSYVVELTSNSVTVQPGQQIEVIIKVKDIVDLSGGIAGLSAKLEYDTSKLEKVGNGEGLNGFLLVEGDTIELAKYPGVTTETEIAKFIFKAKENGTGTTQIKLSEIEVANGTDNIPLGQEITKTISIIPETTEQLSSNNNLSSILIDDTPISNFDKDILTYTLDIVENSKTNINIKAVAEDTKATIAGTGTKKLNIGKNNFKIEVTAEDGTQKVYQINIERKAISNTNNNNINNENNTNNSTTNNSGENNIINNQNDDTKSQNKLPYAGTKTVIGILGITIIMSIIYYIKAKRLSGIK